MSYLYILSKKQNYFDSNTVLSFLLILGPLIKEITLDLRNSQKKEEGKFTKFLYFFPSLFFNILYVIFFYTQYFLIQELVIDENLEKMCTSFFKSQFFEFSKSIKSNMGENGIIKLLDDDINGGFDYFLFIGISFLSNLTEPEYFKTRPLGQYISYVCIKLFFDIFRHIFLMKRNNLDINIYKKYTLNMKNQNIIPKIVFLLNSVLTYTLKRKFAITKIERLYHTKIDDIIEKAKKKN